MGSFVDETELVRFVDPPADDGVALVETDDATFVDGGRFSSSTVCFSVWICFSRSVIRSACGPVWAEVSKTVDPTHSPRINPARRGNFMERSCDSNRAGTQPQCANFARFRARIGQTDLRRETVNSFHS